MAANGSRSVFLEWGGGAGRGMADMVDILLQLGVDGHHGQGLFFVVLLLLVDC